jgi:hypothetical protein
VNESDLMTLLAGVGGRSPAAIVYGLARFGIEVSGEP